MNTLKAVQDYGLEEIKELEAELSTIRRREDEILGELARRRAMHAIATAPAPSPLASATPPPAISGPCPPPPAST